MNSATSSGVLISVLCLVTVSAAAQNSAVVAVPQRDTLVASAPLTISTDFPPDSWVDAYQPIGLRLSRPLNLQTERLAVILGRTDLSALFSVTPLVARYSANTLPLPSGESELAVFLVTRGEPWQELARIPVRVRTRSGFHKTEVKPGLTLTTNGQVAPGDDQ